MKESHDRIQQEVWMYARNKYGAHRRIWHTPNETRPYPGESKHAFIKRLSIMKSIGVTAGVTDLVLYRKGILYALDIKLPGDRISKEQQEFIDEIVSEGGCFFEINSTEQGKNIIDQIYA